MTLTNYQQTFKHRPIKPTTYKANLISDLKDLREATSTQDKLRLRLLLHIRSNQEYLTTPTFVDKARRGYLTDLSNRDIIRAVEEIEQNRS